MPRTTRDRLAATLVAAALGLSVVACSDGGGDGAGAPSAAGESPAADPQLSTTSTAAAQPASGEPIVIGFLNSEGGAFSVPELRIANEVAEAYVNEQLGGVGGRPLRVLRCATDGTPEKSIDCGALEVSALDEP